MRMLCAATLSVLALCRPGAASEPTIVVEGNRGTDAQAIRELFHASSEALLTPAAIDAALKEPYETGLFEDVKIARSGTHLIVTVVEAPLIERLRFEGNRQVKDKDLANEIALKSRGTMTKAAVREDVARIIEIYHRNGRYQVEVTPNTIARGEGRVDLVFDIREGAKTGVKRIAFFGNREFAESRLKGVIKTTESGWFGFLKSSDVYDADRIEADADLLGRFYVKNGFADAHVSAAAAYDPAHQGFMLTFTIDEGARYRLGTIEIDSRIVALDGSSLRNYHDLGNDVIGLVRAQGGYFTPYGGQTLPLTSSFFGGPQLVRGFAVNGFGPRDVTPGTTQDNIGGSRYWTTSAELQAPIPGMPPEIALKTAFFADAGSLWGYRGATSFPSSQSLTVADSQRVRSSIGSSLIWDSPFGALRVDYAYPISKASTDVTQRLHFGVGAF